MQLEVKKGQIFVKGDIYRMDVSEPAGPDVFVIVNPISKVTRVGIPRYKAYMEVSNDDFVSRANNPFTSPESLLKYYSLKDAGQEEYVGHLCNKQVIHTGDQDVMSLWKSPKLNFTLKMVMHGAENMFTELSNIAEKPQDDALFQIPADFQKTTWEELSKMVDADPQMQAKSKEYQKNKPHRYDVSCRMTAGHKFRVSVNPDAQIKIKCSQSGPSGQPFAWGFALYKNGKPLLEPAPNTFTKEAEVKLDPNLKPDDILAEVTEGAVYFNMNLVGRPPLVLATAEDYFDQRGCYRSWTVKPETRKLVLVFTGVTGPDAKTKVNLQITKGEKDAQKIEKFDLNLANGETRLFDFTAADKVRAVNYSLRAGGLKIKIVRDFRQD